ncbi:RHS repeat domain-containing protein [Paraburkholderia megapolitana]|uniref:RHS repeat domain-containing protein n=1 Tax=Paraburkholderia megapolitana TaxID=420953 RepID=UPI0038B94C0B
MAADSDNSQIPAIRSFQFDSSSVGDLRSSVNLFRGDINFTQTLLSMPGRRTGDNLDLSIALLYQSNVLQDATTWNLDAPTSTLGLGWSMPIPTIVLNGTGSLVAATRSYSYVSQSISTDLAREPDNPFVLSLDGSLAALLGNGDTVPAAIVAAFGALGLPLSANTLVTLTGSSAWLLADGDNQQLFNLALNGDDLDVFDGGESYQLVNYQFWKILYYPCYERWVIVNNGGLRQSFGGVTANTQQGYATAAGNSVEWGVRWSSGTDSSGAPVALWQGDSARTEGQVQYACAWHLCQVTNVWGDSVSYRYNDWPRLSDGLLPTVEQRVGPDGLPYTKACYLTGMTDVFGRTVQLTYDDKEWSNATPESPREYADPHKAVPNTNANAYQDQYETLYLQGVTVLDTSGATLFTFTLAYQPSSPAGGAGSPVANVTSSQGELFGDTCKRFLTGITLTNASGDSLPGLAFDYYFDATGDGASPGALKSITYSQGAIATYSYTKQSLDICNRSYTVSPPSGGTFTGATPRVFFGDGYAVVTWYSPANGALSLQVYSWLGNWQLWQPTSDSVIYSNAGAGLTLDTLDVIACEDFFALSFVPGDGQNNTTVYVFQKDNARPSQWVAATINGTQTGLNTPSLTYSGASGSVALEGGSTFLIAATTNAVNGSTSYDRVTWRWSDAAWTCESCPPQPQQLTVTACNEYYLLLDLQGNVSIFALDACLNWNAAATLQIPNFSASDPSDIALTPSDSLVLVSSLTFAGATEISYTLAIVQWDELYRPLLPVPSFDFTDVMDSNFPISWIPSVVGNELVAVSGHVLRFNGATWLENDSLNVSYAPSGLQQRYTYGPDYVAQILAYPNGGGDPAAQVLSFDPDTDCTTWTRAPVTPTQTLTNPTTFYATANWPSSGGTDWLTLGQYLYYRNTACSWDNVMQRNPRADVQALVNQVLDGDGVYVLNSEAVIDEAPDFLAYYVFDSAADSSDQVAATMLRNGRVSVKAQPFSGQRIYTSEEGDTGAGTSPGGMNMFVAYPGADGDFDNASQIILHAYAGDAVEGNLIHYAVTGLAVDNGLGQTSAYSFVPDAHSAACDPTGEVFKYYEATVYPGTSDPSQPAFGWTVNRYLNGLKVLDGADFYNMLDGQLHQQQTYDANGNLRAQSTTKWQVYPTRASSADDPQAPVLNLNGGFLCQTAQTSIEDGVTSTQHSRYVDNGFSAPFSGQVVSSRSTTYGGTGQLETFTADTLFAYQVDETNVSAAMLATHRLSDVAQAVTYWEREGGSRVVSQATASTFASFASAYGGDVQVPSKSGNFVWDGTGHVPFPFEDYQTGEIPKGWLPSNFVLAYTPYGQPAQTRDPTGVVQSTQYSIGSTFAVALFTNASLADGECAYLGFESYESTNGWSINGCTPVSDDAHTGTASLSLGAAGEGSLSVGITPPNIDTTYLLGFWYKTPSGFTPTTGTGFGVTVTVDGVAGEPLGAAFADTSGIWTYQTLGIPIKAGQQSVALDVAAANNSSDAVLLDDIFVAPLLGKMSARIYDPSYRLLTATVDASGTTMRRLYNGFQRLTATTGADEQVKTMSVAFLSREGNASNTFDASAPNADLSLSPADGGVLETFLNGEQWQQHWSASNYPGNWNRTNGTLQHTATTSDTLSWQGGNSGHVGDATSTALYFDLVTNGTLAGPLGITFGSGYTIAFDPSSGFSFAAPDGSTVQSPLGTPPNVPAQWLLVMGNSNVLFFGDGQLLFSASLACGKPSVVSLSTGPNTFALSNLAMLAGPRMSVGFRDASGQKCQTHQWLGSDAVISAVISDAIGRTVAITRLAPASFGSGATLPLLTFHTGFVDVNAFLASMQDSWVMTGDIADYYAGQSDGPVSRSNDEGYPYYGYRFEASPRKRRLEQGVPGKDYAVHDLQETTPATRQTTQIGFGANTSDAFGLPENYATQTVTSPVKNQLMSLRDTKGRNVAASISDETGAVSGQSLASVDFTASASNTSISEPNSFTTSPQSDSSAFASQLQRDGAGRTTQITDPNSGLTSIICDAACRLRFVQPSLDPNDVGFIYYRYDALGRTVEEGTVAQTWDVTTLQKKANDASWPHGDVPFTVVRSYHYDGDGNDPTQIGRKTVALTFNQAPANVSGAQPVTVHEQFTYDFDGRVIAVTLAVDGQPSASGTIAYAYNNLDQALQITYPASSPLRNAFYGYDAAARVVSIGSSITTPTDIASYTYTADGDVELEVRNNGALTGAFEYASPGWPASQSVTVQGANDAAFTLGYEYFANGYPQSRTLALAFDTPQTTQTTYTYDAQGRVVTALVGDSSIGSEQIDQYDANGNIWSLTQDGSAAYAFENTAGTDQLSTLTVDGGTPTSFVYNARGNLINTGSESIDYDPALNLVQGIATGDGSMAVRFAYNSFGQRVLKMVSGAAQADITFSGLSRNPLTVQRDGTWSALVYGPTGLIAAVSDQCYFPLNDSAHTVFATVNSQNQLVAQFAYRAFGSLASATGSSQDAVPFRFMGKEYDDETGLYNFGARLYSPDLRRFLAADTARQFASPYLFVGNNPLVFGDPSGNKMTVGAQIGIGVGMAALAVAGLVLSFFTFGAAAVVTATAEEGIADTLVTADLTAELTTETTDTTVAATTAAEPAATSTSSSIFNVTLRVPQEFLGLAKAGTTVANFATQITTNTMFGVGTAGFQYDCRPGHEFTRKGFDEALAGGAVSGAIFGVMSFGASLTAGPALKGVSNLLLRGTLKMIINVGEGITANDLTQIATNAIEHQPWSKGLAQATWVGAAGGAPFGLGDILVNDSSEISDAISDRFGNSRRGEPAPAPVPGAQAQNVQAELQLARNDTNEATGLLTGSSLNRSYGTMSVS